jgi:hypothetical protein
MHILYSHYSLTILLLYPNYTFIVPLSYPYHNSIHTTIMVSLGVYRRPCGGLALQQGSQGREG